MTKKELRSKYKEKRRVLSDEEIECLSEQITKNILSFFKFKTKKISLFLPIKKQKEINTFLILNELEQCNSIYATKSDFSNISLTHYPVDSNSKLTENEYGIPEPSTGIILPNNKLDIIFVPLLAIDTNGYRLGYGKGFYDRLLSECKQDCIFIGLHYFDELEIIDDLHPNDVSLHYCVTPNKIICFEKK